MKFLQLATKSKKCKKNRKKLKIRKYLNHTLLCLVYIPRPYAPYKLRKVMKGRSNYTDWLFALSHYQVRILAGFREG